MQGADDRPWRAAACHCGTVRFEVRLTGDGDPSRCDCSFCAMRGAVVLTARLDDLRILSGEDQLALYRFNTGTARHHFCRICGIYTHHRRRSDPNEYGVNAACLTGCSPFDLATVPVIDGRNHASDTGGPSRLAGILHYVASSNARGEVSKT